MSENKRIVVSYWSGNLPQVTFLHFLSFRRLNPEIDYVLYLDSDIGFEGLVESSLLTWLQELEISIKSVSLNSIMRESQIPSFSEWKGSYVYSLAGKISRRLIPILSPLLLRASKYKIVYSDLMGWVVGHNFPFSGYVKDRAYRSDLFRSLIFQYWPDCDILYLDLDIVITRPIDFESHQQGAIAQWGTGKSGNSAYLLIPRNANSLRQGILEKLRSGFSALPWVLWTELAIREFDLHVYPSSEIDPAWSPESVIHADTTLFFKSGEHAIRFIEETDRNCIGVHWHNQWGVEPENGSPYNLFLKRFQS